MLACRLRWSDPLEMPILVNAGTEYNRTLQLLLNEIMHNFLFIWEPFLGSNQSWKVQGGGKSGFFALILTQNVKKLINRDSYKLEILHASCPNLSLSIGGSFLPLAIAGGP